MMHVNGTDQRLTRPATSAASAATVCEGCGGPVPVVDGLALRRHIGCEPTPPPCAACGTAALHVCAAQDDAPAHDPLAWVDAVRDPDGLPTVAAEVEALFLELVDTIPGLAADAASCASIVGALVEADERVTTLRAAR